MEDQPLSRRMRVHEGTVREIKRLAFEQMAEGGAGAISMNAIARQMGMSGPALFRYFPNRDALLTELVVEAYEELAAAMEAEVTSDNPREAERMLRAQAMALRGWALAHPQRYLFIFGTPVPGFHPPADRTGPAAWRLLVAAITPLISLVPGSWDPAADPFERELERWATGSGLPAMPGVFLRQAFLSWTRLHGILSLEVAGHFSPALPDPAALYRAEVDELIGMIRDYLPGQRSGS